MAVRSTVLVLLATLVVAVSSAGFLESLLSWDLPNPEARSTSSTSTKCLCQTSGCLCCVDLNLTTTIDLEGPVCVNIKQKDQNVSLNMNYDENPVHNATIKLVDAANKPTCMNLLSDLAQICAKFTSMKKADSGYDGCMVIQPALLGTAQATYHVGCFNFNQSVKQVESTNIVETTSTESGSSADEEDDGLNADELIAAVSASAEQGLALFSQWLGLNFNPKSNATKDDQTHPNQQPQQQQPEQQQQQQPQQQQQRMATFDATSSRSSRTMREEGSDERLKQLLSAQDNVVKGSAIIGQPSGVQTTFIYAKPADPPSEQRKLEADKPSDPQQLTLVPRESRRGGRAYNIHQHVNEI